MRRLGFVLIAGVAVGAALLLAVVGVEPVFAIGWGLAGAALAMLGRLTLPPVPESDGPHIAADPDSRSTEISRLVWALNPRRGTAGERVARRVRGILRYRLERYGVDPDAPGDRARRDELIGPGLWEQLSQGNTTVADIERGLAAIDALSPSKEKI